MGKMEVYDCVVSLMRDLELLLSSYDRLFSSNGDCELSKEKIEDLYQNVSLMDSLLRDSSSSESDTYDQRLIDQLGGDWIASIARAAANYVDSHTSNVRNFYTPINYAYFITNYHQFLQYKLFYNHHIFNFKNDIKPALYLAFLYVI